MSFIKTFIDFILHLDTHLKDLILQFGSGTYVILFFIVFAETGLVVAPFLPGDSLLFAAGTFAALGSFNIVYLIITLIIAAILGDAVNYYVGKYLGKKMIEKPNKIIKKEYLDKTEAFYQKYGKKTIVFARFVPIVRTFAPFVAGIGKMKYIEFFSYNVIGAVLWVVLMTLLGFYFGNIPIVKENFTIAILVIIFLSFLPAIIEFWKHHRSKKK
ncbi:MAG TPA: DedA family protein [Candidatus Nanoarchaeia archaeon]|nr:DedA family protein [Candidatus Nanoarchaeia archaeon]